MYAIVRMSVVAFFNSLISKSQPREARNRMDPVADIRRCHPRTVRLDLPSNSYDIESVLLCSLPTATSLCGRRAGWLDSVHDWFPTGRAVPEPHNAEAARENARCGSAPSKKDRALFGKATWAFPDD